MLGDIQEKCVLLWSYRRDSLVCSFFGRTMDHIHLLSAYLVPYTDSHSNHHLAKCLYKRIRTNFRARTNMHQIFFCQHTPMYMYTPYSILRDWHSYNILCAWHIKIDAGFKINVVIVSTLSICFNFEKLKQIIDLFKISDLFKCHADFESKIYWERNISHF